MEAAPIKIDPQMWLPEWVKPHEQFAMVDGYRYSVSDCIRMAEDIETFEMPLKGININYGIYRGDEFEYFTSHVIAVLKADTNYPIILAPNGVVLDGRHRLAKVIIRGEEFILAKQLTEWPEGVPIEEGQH